MRILFSAVEFSLSSDDEFCMSTDVWGTLMMQVFNQNYHIAWNKNDTTSYVPLCLRGTTHSAKESFARLQHQCRIPDLYFMAPSSPIIANKSK